MWFGFALLNSKWMCNFNSILHHEACREAAAQMVAEPRRPLMSAIACFSILSHLSACLELRVENCRSGDCEAQGSDGRLRQL